MAEAKEIHAAVAALATAVAIQQNKAEELCAAHEKLAQAKMRLEEVEQQVQALQGQVERLEREAEEHELETDLLFASFGVLRYRKNPPARHATLRGQARQELRVCEVRGPLESSTTHCPPLGSCRSQVVDEDGQDAGLLGTYLGINMSDDKRVDVFGARVAAGVRAAATKVRNKQATAESIAEELVKRLFGQESLIAKQSSNRLKADINAVRTGA